MSRTEDRENAGDAFHALIEVMERLRAPEGCPWDQVQTFESIAPYTIEERMRSRTPSNAAICSI